MKTGCIILLGIVAVLHAGNPRPIYQEIRVHDVSPTTLQFLHDQGIPLDHVRMVKGQYIDLVARKDQVIALQEAGVPLTILIEDLGRQAVERSVPAVPREFPLGSMLGNYTFTEAVARMDSLAAQFPGLVSAKQSIGSTIEGRTIWAFKVSDHPDQDEPEPEVLFTGLTHAREPLGMMNLFYFVQTLCESYGEDPLATFLLEEREMWFVPILNPDGYVYNESQWNSFGFPGYHRKNRRDTGCGTGPQRGVDLNRNYSFAWGADNSGSSPNPCSETFRGDSAFSEPETAALRDFVLTHEFRNILHYHAYSNVLIHSYGDGSLPAEPDLTTIREIGAEMTQVNGFPVGTGVELIGYPVNGDAVDWSYGTLGLLSYTPEVGTYQDNFWPSENRVLPLCQEQYYQNQVFALVAGSDPLLYDTTLSHTFPAAGDTVTLDLIVRNRGLSPTNGPVFVELTPIDSLVSVLTAADTLPRMAPRTLDTLTAIFTVAPGAPAGAETGFRILVYDSLSWQHSDSILFRVGGPHFLMGDVITDGELNIFDILELVDILLTITAPTDYQIIVGDLVPDGTLDVHDLLALIDLVMGY
jgi:uncharacterized repeat protein (TIGR01451 family)